MGTRPEVTVDHVDDVPVTEVLTGAWSRGGAAGFTATFEIVAADKAGGGRVKKETHLRGGHRLLPPAAPSCPWPPNLPLAARTTLAIPTCPSGRRGQRTRRQPL